MRPHIADAPALPLNPARLACWVEGGLGHSLEQYTEPEKRGPGEGSGDALVQA